MIPMIAHYENKMKKKINIPPIGMRIIKSAVAIAACYVVSFVREDGIVFYSQLAALWCMQSYISDTRKFAIQRFIGTIIGAVYGLLFLLVFPDANKITAAIVISVMIIIILYSTVIIRKKDASYFSCVVFLSIVVNHASDLNPYLFVFNRFLDTLIGIIIGVTINCFSLPRDTRKDILFLSGLDDTLLHRSATGGMDINMSDFSKIELNRMLDKGLNFSISTKRTPASLLEPMRDIRLKLPVIAMDGAVLYDMNNLRYLYTYLISDATGREIFKLVKNTGLMCYVNVVIDDSLMIYYQETDDEINNNLIEKMRKSPYRNYVKSDKPPLDSVIYFMLLYPRKVMEDFYDLLDEHGLLSRLKVLMYDSTDYPGYTYIKIYNKNASKENMTEYLKRQLNIETTVTFGSIEGRYDVLVTPGDTNTVVREIQKRFEPLKLPKIINKHGINR